MLQCLMLKNEWFELSDAVISEILVRYDLASGISFPLWSLGISIHVFDICGNDATSGHLDER